MNDGIRLTDPPAQAIANHAVNIGIATPATGRALDYIGRLYEVERREFSVLNRTVWVESDQSYRRRVMAAILKHLRSVS